MNPAGWIALVAVLVGVLGLAGGMLRWIRRGWLVVTVEGESMLPAFRPGQRVLARRGPVPAMGDVVVFAKTPGSLMLKRVVAVPGGPAPTFLRAHGDVVPPGMFAVLGDNAADSLDSRVLGYVAAGQIVGVTQSRPRSSETRNGRSSPRA